MVGHIGNGSEFGGEGCFRLKNNGGNAKVLVSEWNKCSIQKKTPG
jgi:hypothetical protein